MYSGFRVRYFRRDEGRRRRFQPFAMPSVSRRGPRRVRPDIAELGRAPAGTGPPPAPARFINRVQRVGRDSDFRV